MEPIALDFSKRTVNIFKVKTNNPLVFEMKEQAVTFDEIERRIIKQELEPLFALETSEVQKIRRAYEDEIKSNRMRIDELEREVILLKNELQNASY